MKVFVNSSNLNCYTDDVLLIENTYELIKFKIENENYQLLYMKMPNSIFELLTLKTSQDDALLMKRESEAYQMLGFASFCVLSRFDNDDRDTMFRLSCNAESFSTRDSCFTLPLFTSHDEPVENQSRHVFCLVRHAPNFHLIHGFSNNLHIFPCFPGFYGSEDECFNNEYINTEWTNTLNSYLRPKLTFTINRC